MKKTNFSMIYLILAVFVILGIFIGIYIANKNGANISLPAKQSSFMWGVLTRQSSLQNYTLEFWNKELDYDKQLGVNWIKVDYDAHAGYKRSVEMVGAATAKKLNVLFQFAPADILKSQKPYEDGYDLGFKMGSKLNNEVTYYQLMSEAASTALRGPEYTGEKESDYDAAKYTIVMNWLKGASDGVRFADPKAKIVINDQWTHFAFFNMIARDGVKYDILGWNWFSDMGFLGDKTLSDGTKVFDKIKSFNKPIIFTEINARPDSIKGMDENVQADFIAKMADFAWANKDVVKGFYVLELTDQPPPQTPSKKPEFYGLIHFKQNADGTYTFGELKKAFTTYQSIIKSHI